ncbi:hypothetical protein QR680_018702 [Steinernema hermaphroditum]|uniref:Major facilitator superfamily (MFS) profile domain-containing protein n=1 Tax=Steinernema hermaphroditum TaxID=289476 RepID=A0AA39LR89_9BILA|nr:hypothetical protein QR680_018702 [Steinernema hermaphroditum]
MTAGVFENERKTSIFRNYTRFAVLAISLICSTLLLSNSLALNFTIICMGSENGTSIYDYSSSQQGWLFSVVAIGSLIGSVPIAEGLARFGLRNVKSAYGLVSGVATILSPLAASMGFYWLLLMRGIQGFALAAAFPATGAVATSWATLAESGTYMALMSCYLQFGPMLTMPVAGAFCVSPIGWSGVYYLQGFLSLVFFALFYYFYRDSPRMHKSVSAKELGRIEKDKTGITGKQTNIPYAAISTNITVVGLWVAILGANAAFQIFLQYGPTYLNKVLHYEVDSTGFATAVPFLLSFITKLVAGPLCDYATCVGVRGRIFIFTSVAQATMAACFVGLALVPTEKAFLGWCAYALAIVCSGLNCVSLFKCGQMVSRQFFPFVMSVVAFLCSLNILIVPMFIYFMAPNNTPEEWALVFYVAATVTVVSTVVFLVGCRTEAAPWTKETWNAETKTAKVADAS